MKRVIKLFTFLILACCCTGCSKANKKVYSTTKYIDEIIKNEHCELYFHNFRQKTNVYTTFDFDLTITNYDKEDFILDYKKVKIFDRINDNVFDTDLVGIYDSSSSFIIKCNQTKTFSFSSIINNMDRYNNPYYIELETSDAYYRYFLYDATFKVYLHINKEVIEKEFPSTTLLKDVLYTDTDNNNYVEKWCYDKDLTQDVHDYSYVGDSLHLYAKEVVNFFETSMIDGLRLITKINYIPDNGVLVLPKKINNKEINGISDDVITYKNIRKCFGYNSNFVLRIVMPSYQKIGSGNFDKANIFINDVLYEGSKEEFNTISNNLNIDLTIFLFNCGDSYWR